MRRSTRCSKQYDAEYDQKKRAALIQEMDGIVANSYQYVLRWDAPFQRIAYWNKFGQPEGLPDAHRRLPRHPERLVDRRAEGRRTAQARWVTTSVKLPVGETEVRYWPQYGEREKAAAAAK